MKKLGRILALVLIFAAIFTFMGAARQTAFAQSCGPSVTHVVQPGENLFRISLRYGKTVAEVAAYNGIANPNFIYPGQVIRIPQ